MWVILLFSLGIRLTYFFEAKTPLERAKLLEDAPLFKNIHAETAQTGQTAPPTDLNVDLHFTCFVEAPDASVRELESSGCSKRLIELDGSRDGPMDHGPVVNFLQVRERCISQGVDVQADRLFCSCLVHTFVMLPQPIGCRESCEGGLHGCFTELGVYFDVFGAAGRLS